MLPEPGVGYVIHEGAFQVVVEPFPGHSNWSIGLRPADAPRTEEFDSVSHVGRRPLPVHSEDPPHLFADGVALLDRKNQTGMRPSVLAKMCVGRRSLPRCT
jgi:hypothetical protein